MVDTHHNPLRIWNPIKHRRCRKFNSTMNSTLLTYVEGVLYVAMYYDEFRAMDDPDETSQHGDGTTMLSLKHFREDIVSVARNVYVYLPEFVQVMVASWLRNLLVHTVRDRDDDD